MTNFKDSELSVGDTFYGVKSDINTLNRKKIFREIDGEQWFKYDISRKEHTLVVYKVLGILRKTLEGDWEPNAEYEMTTEIRVSSETSSGQKSSFTMFEDDLTDLTDLTKRYFLDKDSALAYIEILYEKDKEMDRA
jgi:hypothetical protein